MSLSRGAWIGLVAGGLGTVIGLAGAAVGLWWAWSAFPRTEAQGRLAARMDPRGPYAILATEAAARKYAQAIAEADALHPGAHHLTLSPPDLSSVRSALRQGPVRYALVFVLPEELDVNFAWRWLRLTTELDDDPLVDVRTGFITGESAEAVVRWIQRIRAVAEGRSALPAAVVDNLGPSAMAARTAFDKAPGAFFVPVFSPRCGTSTISHGPQGFTEDRLASMDGAGLLHFGDHGHPDRVDDGLDGQQVRRLKMAPSVVFNGACYTGVTGRWYDFTTGVFVEKQVPPEQCFCLGLLANHAVAYLAALHPDHGIPVYQEMEYLAFTGAPLGDIIKHTHDGVILASGAALPAWAIRGGTPVPATTPSEIMRQGTAARVLFGDPALIATDAITAAPFEIALTPSGEGAWKIVAVLKNADLKSTFTDTYHADLASDPNLFNDRALVTCELPERCGAVKDVRVVRVSARGKTLPHRLVGFAVEKDDAVRRLHVQVDVPTSGYMQSDLRQAGATVELEIRS